MWSLVFALKQSFFQSNATKQLSCTEKIELALQLSNGKSEMVSLGSSVPPAAEVIPSNLAKTLSEHSVLASEALLIEAAKKVPVYQGTFVREVADMMFSFGDGEAPRQDAAEV